MIPTAPQTGPRSVTAVGLAIVLSCVVAGPAWYPTPVAATAPQCTAYGLQDITGGDSESCIAECCTAHASCFSVPECSMGADYPVGVHLACELCNTDFSICIGLCTLGVDAPAPIDDPACESICTAPVEACGMPDACGDRCMDTPVCHLLTRRAEFITLF